MPDTFRPPITIEAGRRLRTMPFGGSVIRMPLSGVRRAAGESLLHLLLRAASPGVRIRWAVAPQLEPLRFTRRRFRKGPFQPSHAAQWQSHMSGARVDAIET